MKSPSTTSAAKAAPAASPQKNGKKERLATALRQNLLRRKAPAVKTDDRP